MCPHTKPLVLFVGSPCLQVTAQSSSLVECSLSITADVLSYVPQMWDKLDNDSMAPTCKFNIMANQIMTKFARSLSFQCPVGDDRLPRLWTNCGRSVKNYCSTRLVTMLLCHTTCTFTVVNRYLYWPWSVWLHLSCSTKGSFVTEVHVDQTTDKM